MRFTWFLLLILLVLPACDSDASAHNFSSDVEECKANLQSIFSGLTVYQHETERLPQRGGVAFFAELIASGHWENDAVHARMLTCPGVSTDKLALKDKDPETWFASTESLDGDWSSYAARDIENHPLLIFPGPGTEAIIACDNHLGPNHDGATNVLMADGSVLTLEVESEIALGNLPEGTTTIVVGPESLLPELRTLSLD